MEFFLINEGFLRSLFYLVAKGSEDLAVLPDGLVFVSSVSATNSCLLIQIFVSIVAHD